MTKKPTTTIPERLELEYMLDQRRLVRGLAKMAERSLLQRTDSDELLSFLNLTAAQVLNKKLLRRRLRQIAHEMTQEKLRELTALLGHSVRLPLTGTIEKWINEQELAVTATVERWLQEAGDLVKAEILPTVATPVALASATRAASRAAETRASVAVLQLNSALIQEIAQGSGSSHYRWITEQDNRVRVNHEPKHDKIYAWNSPPMGGGTRPGDVGHPGSGYGCRCVAEPFRGRA